MRRCLAALLVLLGFMASTGQVNAQYIKRVSGYINPGVTWYFYPRVPNNSARDTIYQISGDLHVSGKLLIANGAEVWFLDNSRIVDSTGGKIIANGYATIPGLIASDSIILFRGSPEGDTSFEWGHFVILPNSDSAYFANVRFTNFRKRNTVDQDYLYSPIYDATHASFNNAINNTINGVGGVIATFSAKTFLYNIIVDSCRASFAGGAFAFLQSPVGWPTPDDGRLALANHQVCLLTIRDTRVYNNETSTPTSNLAQGGAIYMASNATSYVAADNVIGYLGHSPFVTGTPANPIFFTATQDQMLFERCTANNTFNLLSSNVGTDFAEGGAIYVGTNSGLVLSQATFNNDSAIEGYDLNSWGGAICVSPYAGNPHENLVTNGTPNDQMPGLAIMKTAMFNGCVAGMGGAIELGNPSNVLGMPVPRLIVNAENFVAGVRDSGKIEFDGNVAYTYGGAIYAPNQVYITGYLAPLSLAWPGGFDSIELRVKFYNNVAGEGGGSIYLDGDAGGTPDISERRSWHLQNSVNPFDARVNRGAQYAESVRGGGAEYVGFRDSTFSTEYNGNFVIGGNGGAVMIEDEIACANQTAINRYFAENQYNAQNPTIPQDPSASIFPYDQRELTRFIGNAAYLGPDSANLYSYDPANSESAHGRGGAMYIRITSDLCSLAPIDSTIISQARFERNEAYSGSAIWSDQFDLKIMTNLTLISNNICTSTSSATVDLDSSKVANPGDPNVGATIWADFEGPIPSYASNSRNDAIYGNTARYVVRLPVSPVIGKSGVDTLRGNFWGETGPGIVTEEHPPTGVEQGSFFIDYYNGCYTNIYEPNSNPTYSYQANSIGTIPDTLLMEGRIYDLYDRGTNMKTADYSNRRLAPSEAFSLGLPANIVKIHRFTRNIFDQDLTYVNKIDLMQIDFTGPHPLGYPLFLQADVALSDSNRDDNAENYTTYIVLNQSTNEFVRVNLKEIKAGEGGSDVQQTYQGRLDFVPDSSIVERHPNLRTNTLFSLSLLRPSSWTYAEAQRASLLEDSAALAGREYTLSPSDLLAAGDSVFMNCESSGPKTGTWYAGEKYHTLPVRPGDNIYVISRTQLWKYGAAYAIANGLQFTIGNVLPPQFVGDIPALASDPYNPNVRFLKEDVNYNNTSAKTTLFRIGGYDPNNFYDPRFLFNPGNYTQLALTVTPDLFKGDVVPTGPGYNATNALDSVEAHVRLNHWLHQTVIYNQNITGSNGYIQLSGQPHNPDVVPGGESLTATVTNFPPNYNSESGLLNGFPGALGPDSEALSMWVFPPYMNCDRNPDSTTAIPDTLCVAGATSTYHFKIVVMDSVPVFDALPQSSCGYPTPVGILTDSLRYSLDLNTDDEREDDAAAAELVGPATIHDTAHHPAWDFRYGRTSYSFVTQPSWMVEPQGGIYVPIDSSDPNFLRSGIMNVRVDSSNAVNNYLQTVPQVNPNPGELNLDTVAAVVANDGHTGQTIVNWPITILFAPTFITTTLPDAKEGIDYSLNFQNSDSIKRIQVQNLNPEHSLTYRLLYRGNTEYLFRDFPNKVPAEDSMLPNGTWVVSKSHMGYPDTVKGTTPNWLHIDPYSGVLSGIPGDTDAPSFPGTCNGPDTLTVVVTDGNGTSYCVAAWESIPINVDSVNHPPALVRGPGEMCVLNNTQFCDSITVYDPDLSRMPCAVDTITVTDSNGFKINNSSSTVTFTGQRTNDSVRFQICGSFNENQNYFSQVPVPQEFVKIIVHDVSGLSDTMRLPVNLGENPAFECTILVSNTQTTLHPLVDVQQLCFGAGQSATDGIDQQYCEYELAPIPPSSSFDARWVLPIGGSVDGTTIDIRNNSNAQITWQVEFQPGNDGGGAGSLYPIQICWTRSCLDSDSLPAPFKTGHFYLRDPQSAQEFSIDMSNGQGPIDNSLYTIKPVGSDTMCLQIRNQGLTNAIIVYVPFGSGVGTSSQTQFALQPNYPNPFSGATTLNFSVQTRSDVHISIYDVKGALVRTIVNEALDAGSYPVTWDGTDASGSPVPDGTYIATMRAGNFSSSVKMSMERSAQ
jgi:predicted outer membrane repeat protein